MVFNFFSQKKAKLPDNYKELIDEKNYAQFLESCIKVLREMNIKIISSDDGDITYRQENGDDGHYYLDNLLRKYVQLEGENKIEEIRSHFQKLQDKTSAYNYLYKDFEYAKQFLKVLIKPNSITQNLNEFVSRTDYPNLSTFLVLDFEEQFHYIRKDRAVEWQVATNELFEIAIENISNEQVEVNKYMFGEKFPVYLMFSGDFSASYTLLIEKNLEFAIGMYGCLIALPTKGTAFLHSIETKDIMRLIEILYPEIEKFYNEDPGNISLDYYWYYQGRYYAFEKIYNEDQTVTIKLPEKLSELFKE